MGVPKQRRSSTGKTPKPSVPWLARDAPEYEERKERAQFVPPTISIKDVRAAVPRHLFEKSTTKGLYFVGRHVALSMLFYLFATRIEQSSWEIACELGWSASGRIIVSWVCWVLYWFWQSVSFAGMWTLGMCSTFASSCSTKAGDLILSCRRPRGSHAQSALRVLNFTLIDGSIAVRT